MDYQNVKLSKEQGIATIRLNRPDAMNALGRDLVTDLSSALTEVAGDDSVKAMVLRGEGRCFCAGADLKYFQDAFQSPEGLRNYLTEINEVIFQVEDLPIPVIAVVHGFALAGGLELMMACDMALVSDDARIGDQHVNFGLMPGGGSTIRLPRLVGPQRAMELLTTGRWLNGPEAVEWGLALRSAPMDRLDEELEQRVAPLRGKSRPGLGWIKQVTHRGRDLTVRDGSAIEQMAFAQYVATSGHPAEGVQAFVEKRTPQF